MKKINYPGISHPISVNVDGTQIVYDGQPVNQFLVKSQKHRSGYYAVSIENKQIYTHNLVALSWVPNPNNYPLVLHNDCNTTYNYYRNLSWGTRYMAMQNMKALGIIGSSDLKFRGSSKINYEETKKIVKRLENGETGRQIAAEYGVSEMSICRIKKRYMKTKEAE